VIICSATQDQIQTWNRGSEVLFGYTEEEVIGKHLSMPLPPERFHELEGMRTKVELSGASRHRGTKQVEAYSSLADPLKIRNFRQWRHVGIIATPSLNT
jgi:PAS domain S-box-containing protein